MWTFYSRPKLSLSSLKLSGDPVVQIAIRTGNQTYADTDIPMTMKICDGYGNCCFTNGPLHRQSVRWRRVLGAVDIYEDKDSLGQCNKVRFSFQVVINFPCLIGWLIDTDELLQPGILVGEPPVKNVELITRRRVQIGDNGEITIPPLDKERFLATSWFVKWVLITLEDGNKFFCEMEGWIDQKFVFVNPSNGMR